MKRQEVAEGTMAFHFEKPRGFQFRPGQYADLTLVNPPETDGEGNNRTFSIVSPPYEDELVFATRMRNTAFKRVLRAVPLGTEVGLDGPMGSFTLHKNVAKPGVFLTGGIGITPFLSILRQVAKDELSYQLYLFYCICSIPIVAPRMPRSWMPSGSWPRSGRASTSSRP